MIERKGSVLVHQLYDGEIVINHMWERQRLNR
jgi:hypothetical protein